MLYLQLLKSQFCWRAFRSQNAPLKSYYQNLLAQLDKPVAEVSFMALDLEMTGLNPAKDQILSIGLVPIEKGFIKLKDAQHQLLQIQGSVGQSATIHGILDVHLQQGKSLDEVMDWFFTQIQGKVLLAHHAPLDLAFLEVALVKLGYHAPKLVSVDTLALEKKRLLRQNDILKEGSLRLGATRARYGLPVYAAHNALMDALACGELLLAQIATISGGESSGGESSGGKSSGAKSLKLYELF